MKSQLIAVALAGLALTSSAFAYSPNDARPASPAPRVLSSSVVKPTGLPYNFKNAVINVEFSLDASGQPRNVKVLWVDDPVLKRQLLAAFRQWRFEVDARDANETGKRFILPIELRADA